MMSPDHQRLLEFLESNLFSISFQWGTVQGQQYLGMQLFQIPGTVIVLDKK